MENGPEVTALLETYQVPLYISGHLHVQRIREHVTGPGLEEVQNGIHEIVLSPYSFPGNQYGMLSWEPDDTMTFESPACGCGSMGKDTGIEKSGIA